MKIMNHNQSVRATTFCTFSIVFLALLFSSFAPSEREKHVFKGDQFTIHYETVSGRLDGHYVAWYPNGQKRSEGYFANNHRTGQWRVWDSTGHVLVERHYYDLFSHRPGRPVVKEDGLVKIPSKPSYAPQRNESDLYEAFDVTNEVVVRVNRTWRMLTPAMNPTLFHEHNLFELLLQHWESRDLTPYLDEDFRHPRVDGSIDASDYEVIAYKVVEDGVYDTVRFVHQSFLISLCPVAIHKPTGDTLDLFWVYYPHQRKWLVQYPVSADYICYRVKNLDDLLFLNCYGGEIYKSDNVYDRPISAYKKGDEIALEAQRIELSLIEEEHSIWAILIANDKVMRLKMQRQHPGY